ncbi:MAG: hypothetical protein ACFFHD_12240 [Promethearchaeota archaeon]
MIQSELLLNFLKLKGSIEKFQDKFIEGNEIVMRLRTERPTIGVSSRHQLQFILIKNKNNHFELFLS